MLKNLNLFISFLLFVFFLMSFTGTKTFADDKKLIAKYLQVLQAQHHKVCKNADREFWEKFKNYKGEGHFVPLIEQLNQTIFDQKSTREIIPLIDKKIAWLEEQIRLLKMGSSIDIDSDIQAIRESLLILLNYKKEKEFLKKHDKQLPAKSRKELQHLRDLYWVLLKKIPFMQSFEFPVDHFQLRKDFDAVKDEKFGDLAHRKNFIYLKRRLLEDGLFNERNLSVDYFTRALLSTLAIRLEKLDQDFLSEDLRYDLVKVLIKLESEILDKNSKKLLLSRFENWLLRVQKQKKYYLELLDESLHGHEEFVQKLLTARNILKDFNFRKQSEVYNYWIQQDELLQAMFAIDTIVYNEVGDIDAPHALERRDVAKLVINRVRYNKFTELSEQDELLRFLKKEDTQKRKGIWLQTLLKTGEFSFSYFFIPLSMSIYCPEQTARAKRLRTTNLKLILPFMRDKKDDFKAIRFYSRSSMLGGIDMAELWKDYSLLPEKKGRELKGVSQKIKKKVAQGDFIYWYQFAPSIFVIDLGTMRNPKPILIERKAGSLKWQFYEYRNPQLFRYFTDNSLQ